MKYSKHVLNLSKKRLEVYLAGCSLRCKGCHNPELQDFQMNMTPVSNLKNLLESQYVQEVWILGGDPLEENNIATTLTLIEMVPPEAKVVVFTGRSLEEIWKSEEKLKELLSKVDYLKVGPYLQDSGSYVDPLLGITLASNNQRVLKGGRGDETSMV